MGLILFLLEALASLCIILIIVKIITAFLDSYNKD